MKIAIDAMGGDHAPKEIVLGAMKAVQHFTDVHITLFGDEAQIRSHLTKEERITIIHTDEVIEASAVFARPEGIYWQMLMAEKIAEIPVLQAKRRLRH